MSANKKNNINTDRPIIQSSGYNGSEPVRICPNCKKPKPISGLCETFSVKVL